MVCLVNDSFVIVVVCVWGGETGLRLLQTQEFQKQISRVTQLLIPLITKPSYLATRLNHYWSIYLSAVGNGIPSLHDLARLAHTDGARVAGLIGQGWLLDGQTLARQPKAIFQGTYRR